MDDNLQGLVVSLYNEEAAIRVHVDILTGINDG